MHVETPVESVRPAPPLGRFMARPSEVIILVEQCHAAEVGLSTRHVAFYDFMTD
jgi:hypothetical protein